MVGGRAPAFALGFAALNLINANLSHVLSPVKARKPNPGFFTACAFYIAAGDDGVLSAGTVILNILIGALRDPVGSGGERPDRADGYQGHKLVT
jgi:hypothetical protein